MPVEKITYDSSLRLLEIALTKIDEYKISDLESIPHFFSYIDKPTITTNLQNFSLRKSKPELLSKFCYEALANNYSDS